MEWFYLVVYALAFAVLCSIAVSRKNRNQAGWFFIGLLFGVFGLIAAILMSKIEQPATNQPRLGIFDPSAHSKKCPECAETIKVEAKVCRFCQHRFSDEEVRQQIDSAAQAYATWQQIAGNDAEPQ